MSNIGIVPLDPASDVGKLRILIGDTASTPLVPDQPGYGNYAVFSDVALSTALATEAGNALRAAGLAFTQMAAQYIQVGRSIKTDDLLVDTRSRGADLMKVAQSYYAQADLADQRAAKDFFKIVPSGGRTPRTVPDPIFVYLY